MKYTLFIICFLGSLVSQAQTDTTQLRSGKLTLRVNDWEYIAPIIAFNQTYENLYDSIKTKLRFGNYPSGTTQVTVDSVTNGELVALYRAVKNYNHNDATSSAIGRITAAIKGMNPSTHYVNRTVTQIDTDETSAFTSRRQLGKNIYRKQ